MVYANASQAFKLLNGIFCIHKPKGVAMDKIVAMLKRYIIKDLNNLESRPVKYCKKPVFIEEENSGDLIEIGRVTAIDYAQHPLVLGPFFKEYDIEIQPIQKLEYNSSGICLMAINDGCDSIEAVHKSRPLKVYRAECKLGRSTLNYWDTGKITEKTTYVCGAPIQSQEAYEIASRGLARPKEDSSTIIYKAECLQLEKSHFTLEIHAVNEIDEHLCGFIDDLGVRLRSSACVSSLNRLRHGVFDSDHSLLMKHWTLSNIIRNIVWCAKLLTPETLKLPHLLTTLDQTALPRLEQSKYIETVASDLDNDPDESSNDQEFDSLNRGLLNEDFVRPKNLRTRPELLLPLMDRNTLDID
uniref:Pseudouridine synthase II N-terminal domain-containing protein n=1 Tax=Romanomermis culicivorax TaxID=13658 RepID=A0A915KSN9_ROMCU